MTSEPKARPSKRIRLCIVMGGHWSVQMGGAQYQVKCILEELSKYPEFEIFFLANVVPEQSDQGVYQIVRVGFRRRIPTFRMLPNMPSLYLALRRLRPVVVYQRELMSFTGVCGIYCKRHKARFVFHMAHDNDARKHVHTGWSFESIRNRFEYAIAVQGIQNATAIIAQTDDQARMLKENYGIDAAAVVKNFHPLPAEAGIRREVTPLRVIWVANFKAWKHPELFVDLAEALRHRSDIQFVMIGRSGSPKAFEALYGRISASSNLSYLGELPIERVNEEIAASHVFVNTSSAEGFANTFIQAWLRAVPVVSLNVDPDGCLSEGGGGLVAGSLERLTEVIQQLADDRSWLERIANAAKDYGFRNHRPEQAHALIDILAGGALKRTRD